MIALAAITLGLAPKQQTAEAKAKSEALMSAALTATELKFRKSASGLSFIVDFDHPNNRKRQIMVNVTSDPIEPIKGQYIYTSVIVTGTTPPTEKQLLKTLPVTKKLGNFYVYKDSKNTYVIRFGVHFDAGTLSATPGKDDASVIALKDTIYFVNQVGEEAALDLEKG
jgi:hypothetical protein